MKNLLVAIIALLLCSFQLFSQQVVTGTVTDAEDGSPLVGATIAVQGTSTGTIADIDGNYSISVPAGAVLVFSYVGYNTREIEVGDQTRIDLALEKSTTELEELVVIGYGSRRRKDVTSAISTVNAEELTKTNAVTPELAMQGKLSGVFVQSGGSEPFTRPTVRIRGTNTWGVAEPLYVIDGVPITEYGSGAESIYSAGGSDPARIRDLRSPVNIMSMINPNDIENISVLKDATAAAIYGVRAANGVVLITTKQGKAGKPTIEFNYKYGIQNIPKTYEALNVDQYVDIYNEMFRNNTDELPNLPDVFKDSVPDAYLGNMPTIDWQTPILNKNAPLADYNLKISGGSEATNYYFSLTHNNTESVFINSWQKRYGFTTNINTRPYKWLRAGINYRFIYTDVKDESGSSGHGGDLWRMAYMRPPWQEIYDPDGPAYLKGYAATNDIYSELLTCRNLN